MRRLSCPAPRRRDRAIPPVFSGIVSRNGLGRCGPVQLAVIGHLYPHGGAGQSGKSASDQRQGREAVRRPGLACRRQSSPYLSRSVPTRSRLGLAIAALQCISRVVKRTRVILAAAEARVPAEAK